MKISLTLQFLKHIHVSFVCYVFISCFSIDSYSGRILWLSNFTDLYMDLVTNKFSEVIAGRCNQ